jgi:hypothetical protein
MTEFLRGRELYFTNTHAALELWTGRSLQVTFFAAGSIHFAR